MSGRASIHETEIKLSVESPARARRLVRSAGFRPLVRRTFESNVVFDTPDLALRGRGCLLRVRRFGRQATLTYKGTALAARHKTREELETEISDPAAAERVLARLGFHPALRYDKYRAVYGGGAGLVTIDETPIGVFLELEGTPRWIDATARKLGFSERDYITASYGRLYIEHCRAHGVEPSHMVFAARSTSRSASSTAARRRRPASAP